MLQQQSLELNETNNMSVRESSLDYISAEELAKICFTKFKSLPKTGKPNKTEWTILSGVVLHNSKTRCSKVISLGCGTKCIGKSKLCAQGLILNDSHAEILARRGLLRYFYHHIKYLINNDKEQNSIFIWIPEKKKFKLKDELSLHFLSTQTPCGDACIVDKKNYKVIEDETLSKRRKKMEENYIEPNVDCNVDTVYTGAKLIGSHHADAMEQSVGALRTKPGRGERTLSMSCGDKLAKWQIMGIQGALLDILLESPIYLNTLNFCGHNDINTIERAIWKRFRENNYNNSKYTVHIPQIRLCSSPNYEFSQDASKQPSPNCLVWCDIPENMKPYEISVNGKRQGITSKKANTTQAALNISKFYLLKEFIDIINMKEELLSIYKDLNSKTYIEIKLLAKEYQNAWSCAKANYFGQWSQKSHNILEFSINSVKNYEENKEKC